MQASSPSGSLNYILERAFAVFGLMLMLGALAGLFQDLSNTQVGTGSNTQGNLPYQLTAGSIFAISVALIATRLHQFYWLCVRNWALVLLVAMTIISVMWSSDPSVTLRRAIALTGTSLFAVCIVMRFREEEALKLLVIALGIGAVGSYLLGIVAPNYAIHRTGAHIGYWHGLWDFKNSFGRIMVLGVVAFLIQYMASKQHRGLLFLGVVACFGLVILSGSRTAWVTLAILLFAFWPLRALRNSNTSLALRLLVVFTVFVCGGLFLLASFYQEGLELIGRDEDLSSRTKIWAFAFEFGMAKPILGHGYRVFWTVDNAGYIYRLLNWDGGIGHAHNGYIDVWLDLGFVGLGLFIIAFVVAIRNALARLTETTDAFGYWYPICLIFLAVTGITERTFLQQGTIEWVLFVTLSFYLTIPRAAAQPATSPAPRTARPLGRAPAE